MAIHNFRTKKRERKEKRAAKYAKRLAKECRPFKTNKKRAKILSFVTEYRPPVPNRKNIPMSKWHLIENQPLQREI